jgi:hypothetical protein
MNHADDCLICSRERKAAMRSFGADCGSRSLLLGDRAEKGFCHDVEFRWRRGLRPSILLPRDAHRREQGEPADRCRFLCTRSAEADNPGDVGLFRRGISPRDINAKKIIRPQRFSCKGSDTDPAPYNTYWYDGGKTFSFKLDNAMAIIVEDDKTNEIAINTWFMPRYTKHK